MQVEYTRGTICSFLLHKKCTVINKKNVLMHFLRAFNEKYIKFLRDILIILFELPSALFNAI